MRDEVYAFFIRFIYNTGEKSSSYHIPGRAPDPNGFTLPDGNTVVNELDVLAGDNSAIDGSDRAFEIYNTAHDWWDATTSTQYGEDDTNDGGVKIVDGHMAYWESS